MKIEKKCYLVPEEKWGTAISYTYEKEDGTMWVGNYEYESQVNYCPITGKAATKQMVQGKDFENSEKEIVSVYE